MKKFKSEITLALKIEFITNPLTYMDTNDILIKIRELLKDNGWEEVVEGLENDNF